MTTALNAVWGVLHHLGGTASPQNPARVISGRTWPRCGWTERALAAEDERNRW